MAILDINTIWSAGKVIHGYTMLTDGHEGSNSIWGKAKSPTGQTVFFKKYTSPSSLFTDWYRGYVEYQKELKRRIDSISVTDARGRNQGPTYRFLEFFEELGPEGLPEAEKSPEYYQVLEYIDGAKDLEKYLKSSETTWNDRMKFASVFMYAMKTLHADNVKIIHADLKPGNLLLIPTQTSTGASTYQIKIIDLDASLLADIQAPWHGDDQYVGTQGYYSPEHLRGQVPTAKSDVFTCGLILYEILTTCGHPYNRQSSLEIYEGYTAPVPQLRGTYGSPEKDAAVAQMLHRMLDPNPDNRPTALEVQRTLIGNVAPAIPPRPVSSPQPPQATPSPVPPIATAPTAVPVATVPAPPPAPVRTFAFCKLKSANASEGIRVFPNSRIGYRFLEMIEPTAKNYYSREHFAIHFRDGKWFVSHCAPPSENRTALNGVLVTGEMELHDGDQLAACSQNGSRTAMPFTIEIGG